MYEKLRPVSPALYATVLLCFFLPFTHVSCSGERVATLTGVQLVTGTTIGQPNTSRKNNSIGIERVGRGPFDQSAMLENHGDGDTVPAEPLAIAVACAALAGFVLGFWKTKARFLAGALPGVVGVVMLLLLKAKIDNEVLKQGEGAIQVQYASGFWLVLLLLIAAVGLNAYLGYLAGKPSAGGTHFGPPTIDGPQALLKDS
jgi:hypothetical protein